MLPVEAGMEENSGLLGEVKEGEISLAPEPCEITHLAVLSSSLFF